MNALVLPANSVTLEQMILDVKGELAALRDELHAVRNAVGLGITAINPVSRVTPATFG